MITVEKTKRSNKYTVKLNGSTLYVFDTLKQAIDYKNSLKK